jgi:hypothetical protein
MKILYLSCHSILEYDEVKLLHELGHEVFSPGAYIDPQQGNEMRPAIDGLKYNSDILQKFHAIGQKFPGKDSKDHLTKELVDCFDMVIVMHLPRWVINNWDVMKHKRVVWRTIGQSIEPVEKQLATYRKQGMQIIRYSSMERNIPGCIGGDCIIRFYKDPEEYKNWNGNTKRVITVAQHMERRNQACNFKLFEEVTRSFDRHLFGPGSETLNWGSGKVPYEQLKEEMRNNRVYFYTGTHPASYTLNFIEAMMTGIPIVAVGPKYGNASYFLGHNLYEIPNIIDHGVNGFISDDPNQLSYSVSSLMKDDNLAKDVSKKGRETAIALFGKEVAKRRWNIFLEKLDECIC